MLYIGIFFLGASCAIAFVLCLGYYFGKKDEQKKKKSGRGGRTMKYPNWDGYTDEQKDKAVAEELRLETHNGTTKDDLLNIIRYLAAKVKEAGR